MSKSPLDRSLIEESYRFEFFQAVRLFERIFPDRKAVGREALPMEEVLRFRSNISLDFPPSEIQEIRPAHDEGTDSDRFEVIVNFMGMAGVSGVLPTHYTEVILDRIRHRDTAMWAFLDIFTHRSVSLFYRAWCKYRFPVNYERGDDDFTSFLFDFAGLGTNGLRGRMGLADESLLPYTGLIAQKPHSMDAIQNMLSDYFRINAKIVQFFGQWLVLNTEDTTKLGVENVALGSSAIIGSRIWSDQTKFRVKLGPLSFQEFQAFLPVGSAFKPLKSIVRFMVGFEFDFDVQLLLKAKQVPGSILTTQAKRRPLLGWTSFLKTEAFKLDDDQVIMEMES
ncbi:MAG: type VI secretion system baseplate subunit TssG [Pyrinomonadaceae bacterium]